MVVIALLVPVMFLLAVFALDLFEHLLFPTPPPPPSDRPTEPFEGPPETGRDEALGKG